MHTANTPHLMVNDAIVDRLHALAVRCAELWNSEPSCGTDRSSLLGRLAEIENTVAVLQIRTIDGEFAVTDLAELDACERDLDGLVTAWSAPRAA